MHKICLFARIKTECYLIDTKLTSLNFWRVQKVFRFVVYFQTFLIRFLNPSLKRERIPASSNVLNTRSVFTNHIQCLQYKIHVYFFTERPNYRYLHIRICVCKELKLQCSLWFDVAFYLYPIKCNNKSFCGVLYSFSIDVMYNV